MMEYLDDSNIFETGGIEETFELPSADGGWQTYEQPYGQGILPVYGQPSIPPIPESSFGVPGYEEKPPTEMVQYGIPIYQDEPYQSPPYVPPYYGGQEDVFELPQEAQPILIYTLEDTGNYALEDTVQGISEPVEPYSTPISIYIDENGQEVMGHLPQTVTPTDTTPTNTTPTNTTPTGNGTTVIYVPTPTGSGGTTTNTAAAADDDLIFGFPQSYVLYGGIGVAAAIALYMFTSKK